MNTKQTVIHIQIRKRTRTIDYQYWGRNKHNDIMRNNRKSTVKQTSQRNKECSNHKIISDHKITEPLNKYTFLYTVEDISRHQ